jgi:hypothetical protein
MSSLGVRAQHIDFEDPDWWERSLDDLILILEGGNMYLR